jgi:GAF domain-containing protein
METRLPAAERALQAVESSPDVPALLRATCLELVELLDADGCVLSRVIGELLIEVAEHSRTGRPLQLGHGYLIPDFPVTQQVIVGREARSVSLLDPAADPAEAAVLRELCFESLLMLPLECGSECWGLVEIYAGPGRQFEPESAHIAGTLVARVGQLLEQLRLA